MRKLILKIGIMAVLAIIILPALQVVAATEPYTLLAPLPNLTTVPGDNPLGTYVPFIFNLLIGLSAVWAVLMIVIGGFQYMTTDAVMKKTQGKERIKNAVFGLVLVIAAWIILNTVNPNLLKLSLDISPVTTTQTGGEGTLSPALPLQSVMDRVTATCPGCSTTGGLSYNISQANLARFSCQTCSALGTGIPFKNTNVNVAPALNTELSALNSSLAQQGVAWWVTEAFPPMVNHVDDCHYNGTCIDAALSDPSTLHIKNFIDTAVAKGLSPSYEVLTQKDADTLIASLKAIGLSNPVVKVNTDAKGAHFHVK
jgi:hypothetical protein